MALGDGSAYPGTIDNYGDPQNKVDVFDARYISDLNDAINKIETELGTDPAGSVADLKTRLAVSLADSGALAQGTSDPGSPVIGQPIYRTDTDQFKIYDGSAWDVIGPAATSIKSSTAVSASANSGDISIEPDKVYLVCFEFVKNTADGDLSLRFNSASGASDYARVYRTDRMTTSASSAVSGDDSSAQIVVFPSFETNNAVAGYFHLDTTKKNTDSAFVVGSCVGAYDNTGIEYHNCYFSGVYLDDVTLADFEFFSATGTLTGNIYVYERALTT